MIGKFLTKKLFENVGKKSQNFDFLKSSRSIHEKLIFFVILDVTCDFTQFNWFYIQISLFSNSYLGEKS